MTASDRKAVVRLALAFPAFVSLGLPDGVLGVAWPSIRSAFALPLDAIGPLLVATTTGYVASSFASGGLLARRSVGALLALSCLATAASLLGYAVSPRFAAMVAFGLLAGLGAGAIDAGLNTYVATNHGPRTLNWLHACYGLGAAAGPLVMTQTLMAGLAWRWGYAFVGLAQLVLALAFAATLRAWPRPEEALAADASGTERSRPAARTASTLRLPAAWLAIAAFFVYTGLEAVAGAWAYTLFTEGRGFPMETVGVWVSLYWGGLTAGRLLFGFAIGAAPLRALLRGCLVALALASLLVTLRLGAASSMLALVLLGLACGPVFPTLIAVTPARLGGGHTANAVGFQVAAAAVGQSLLPATAGVLARHLGLEILGPLLLGAALLLAALHEALLVAAPEAPERETGVVRLGGPS